MKALKNISVTAEFDSLNSGYFQNKPVKDKAIPFSCSFDPSLKSEWSRYAGTYIIVTDGMDLKWFADAAYFLDFGHQKIVIFKEGELLN